MPRRPTGLLVGLLFVAAPAVPARAGHTVPLEIVPVEIVPVEIVPVEIVSFNVLGPLWAAPEYFPDDIDPALLAAETRRERIGEYLSAAATTAELICLQEVTQSEYPALVAAIGPGFVGAMAFNDRDFWSSWIVPPLVWEPNGTAIFASRAAFDAIEFADVALGTGNHAVRLTATHVATGAPTSAWSIHLDSDRASNRRRELDRLLATEGPWRPGQLDIVCGDFNDDTVSATLGRAIGAAGFVDAHVELDTSRRTHPWSEQYNRARRWAVIDHVIGRGATPVTADVIDAGVEAIGDQDLRIAEYLRRMGSDHYAVTAVWAPTATTSLPGV